MTRTCALITLALLGGAIAAPHASATEIGVTIEVSQPGVYGRVDIGRFPQPRVIVPQPVIIAAPPVVIARPQPVYLWVPPGHRKDWRRHCSRYNACGVPVYFVRHDWYRDNVRGRGDDRDRRDDDRGRGRGYDDDRRHGGHDRDHGHDRDRGHDHGPGKGRGRGRD
jgi:hypothetical protein